MVCLSDISIINNTEPTSNLLSTPTCNIIGITVFQQPPLVARGYSSPLFAEWRTVTVKGTLQGPTSLRPTTWKPASFYIKHQKPLMLGNILCLTPPQLQISGGHSVLICRVGYSIHLNRGVPKPSHSALEPSPIHIRGMRESLPPIFIHPPLSSSNCSGYYFRL